MRYVCQDCDKKFRSEDDTPQEGLMCPKCGGRLWPLTKDEKQAESKPPAPEPRDPTTVPEKAEEDERPEEPSQPSAPEEPAAAAGAASCPSCGAEMAEGAVICVQCGLNVKTGEKLETQVEDAEGDADEGEDKE